MALVDRGVEVRQSRISYFYNYVLVALMLVFFVLVWMQFDLTFTLFPQKFSDFSKSFIVLAFVFLIAVLFEEPVIRRWFRKYTITNNEVIKVEGIIRKKRVIIPYQSVANVRVYKGVLGRILNFGDVEVVGFKNQINMRGLRGPEVFYRIINNKIAVMRGTAKRVASVEESAAGKKILSVDWRKEQRALEKKIQPLGAMAEKKKEKIDIFGFLKRPIERPIERVEYFEEAEEETEAEEAEAETEKKKTKRKRRKRKKSVGKRKQKKR